jgi:hypothetical protein
MSDSARYEPHMRRSAGHEWKCLILLDMCAHASFPARLDCADVILLVLSTHASFCWI